MISRERILEAAERVYARHGFRGATTRLIAQEAGVNEVTLFRIFGSKAALLDEVARGLGQDGTGPRLPDRPAHPARELTEWATGYLQEMRNRRSLMRKTIGEFEERPDVRECVGQGPIRVAGDLSAYVKRLQRAGFADAGIEPTAPVATFMAALFCDAMLRELIAEILPPPARAPEEYARTFLRALGAPDGRRRNGRRAPSATRTRTR